MVFFESPKRLIKTLSVMKETFLPSRQVVICREMTKLHEEVIRGSIAEILKKVSTLSIKGEVCLLVEGEKSIDNSQVNLNEDIKRVVLQKLSPSEAAKLLSLITKQNKRDLYKWLTEKG